MILLQICSISRHLGEFFGFTKNVPSKDRNQTYIDFIPVWLHFYSDTGIIT